MKSGNNLFKVGNNVFRYNSQLTFGSALSQITATQGGFNSPRGIAIDYPSSNFPNGRVFVTNYSGNTVSILNYTNPWAGSPVVITQAQGSFSNPQGIAIDPPSTNFPNGRIFVTNYNNGANTVSILNYLNPTAGSPATVGGFSQPSSIVIDFPSASFVNGRIFVTNVNSSTVSVLSYLTPTSGVILTITQAQGTFSAPASIAIDTTGSLIYVANGNSTVSILNYLTPNVGSPTVITKTQGGFYTCWGIAINSQNNRIFVVNIDGNNVSILNYTNPTAGSPTMITINQGTFGAPSSIAIDTINNRIFIPNLSGSTVSIITNNFT